MTQKQMIEKMKAKCLEKLEEQKKAKAQEKKASAQPKRTIKIGR